MDEEVITVILLSVCSVIMVAPSEIRIFSNPVTTDSWESKPEQAKRNATIKQRQETPKKKFFMFKFLSRTELL